MPITPHHRKQNRSQQRLHILIYKNVNNVICQLKAVEAFVTNSFTGGSAARNGENSTWYTWSTEPVDR